MLYVIATLLLISQASATSEKEGLNDIRAFLQISEQLATSGQIGYDQIDTIKDAGYEVVVNLAPARKERNAEEGFRVTESGMTYVQIPVSWEEPALRDLQLFFDIMDANRDRKVYVHCFANMRVSAFVYLYRTLRLGESHENAHTDLAKIWDPASEKQWEAFIKKARSKMSDTRNP